MRLPQVKWNFRHIKCGKCTLHFEEIMLVVLRGKTRLLYVNFVRPPTLGVQTGVGTCLLNVQRETLYAARIIIVNLHTCISSPIHNHRHNKDY